MATRLKYSKIDLVERAGALLLVTFLDDAGNMYQWAPKWDQVQQVFLKQVNVERFNKPESAFLNRFARTAQGVFNGAQRISSARKISGALTHYAEQLLTIDGQRLVPGFEVSIDFLDQWLGAYVEAFAVNDMVIRIKSHWSDEGGADHFDEYPPQTD